MCCDRLDRRISRAGEAPGVASDGSDASGAEAIEPAYQREGKLPRFLVGAGTVRLGSELVGSELLKRGGSSAIGNSGFVSRSMVVASLQLWSVTPRID